MAGERVTATVLDRVRAAVLRAFDRGMLGVMAAQHNIPEGNLRQFACGDNCALTHEQALSLALSLPKETT